jgi:hypothetical protein
MDKAPQQEIPMDNQFVEDARGPHAAPTESAERARAAVNKASVWRNAIGRLAMPALRLHRYRNARTRMLYDALRDLDGGR